ncbi:putative O-methyltransferase [Annulohypoxylon maeteangense]|uniref:putative O-methyltransferase n=1 Tax=Annulohypoxylon maeteangense TaxID=1927788 RepID=UPI002007CC66|nr:putative O-methyltransferase [Annulohypoxylon maeteangense]KAI0888330.1 putative O-methyltransferase [Annulohypoxylon maeteangense]
MEGLDLVLNKLEAFTAADFEGYNAERLQMLAIARKLVSRLQSNGEKAYEIAYQQSLVDAALRVCIDIGLWHGWTAAGGGEKPVKELVGLTTKACELNLLRRLLRLLGAANIIEETGEDRYKPTQFSLSIGDDSTCMAQAIISKTDHWDMSHLNLPSFLAKTSYREPKDAKNTSYIDANPERLPIFDRFLTNKSYRDSLRGFLYEYSKYRVPWTEFYDTASLIEGADLSSGPLVVDVGGLHGADLLKVLDKHPDLPTGALVLQDLAGAISGVTLNTEKIKLMEYNFFKPEPLHGSRAYFLHMVLHDWPDALAIQILQNIKPALKRGYSKILICEIVMPRTGASMYQASLDVSLMANLSAYERTEAEWKKVINEAGLEMVSVTMDPRGFEGVIEVELA